MNSEKSIKIKINKSVIYIIGIFLLVFIAGFFILTNNENVVEKITTENSDKETQKIVLSMKNYNYYPNTINVKVNQPVSISLDESVVGCLRSFTIKEFGINEYLINPEDSIIFTPTKTGIYNFACSMNMANGKLIVEK